jgi:hypothetical protein
MRKLFSLQLRGMSGFASIFVFTVFLLELQPSTLSFDDRVREIMGKLKMYNAFGTDKGMRKQKTKVN